MATTVYTTEEYEEIREQVNPNKNKHRTDNFEEINNTYNMGVSKQDGEFVFNSKFDIYFTLLLCQKEMAHPDIYTILKTDSNITLTSEQLTALEENPDISDPTEYL